MKKGIKTKIKAIAVKPFNTRARKEALEAIRDIIMKDFGPKCGDRESTCAVCIAWGNFEDLSEAIGLDVAWNKPFEQLSHETLSKIMEEDELKPKNKKTKKRK